MLAAALVTHLTRWQIGGNRMKKGIVFVPGITGSELVYTPTNEKIWPPDLGDVFLGYQKFDKLSDPKQVSVGNVIDNDLIIVFYQTTEEDLRYISNLINNVSSGGPYCPAPYDWRQDLLMSVDTLISTIDKWYNANPSLTELTLVCHSMGGLVGRLLMEWKYASATPPKWFKLIDRLLFICTPHLGAPKALAESLGLEDVDTLSMAQLRQFAADTNFPSGYELMPDSSREILYDWNVPGYVKYDDASVARALGLPDLNLKAGNRLRTSLDVNKRPKGVKYFYIYGTGFSTDGGVAFYGPNFDKAYVFQWPNDSSAPPDEWGDTVVPAWSVKEAAALASPKIPTWSGVGDHIGILQTPDFRQKLYSYFGVPGRAPSLATDRTVVVVCLNKKTYKPGETIDGLLILESATDNINGTYMLKRFDERSRSMVVSGQKHEIIHKGGTPTKVFPIRLVAPTVPGVYRLEFNGDGMSYGTTDKTAGGFAVTPGELHPRGRIPPR
jgi:pimeloyl-ACP methyl ester carboxylesterase